MDFIYLIPTILLTASPLIYAALGELIVEKSGVINLSVEGMMLIGAVSAAIFGHLSGSWLIAIFAAMLFGSLMSFIFVIVNIKFQADQIATGLALTLFGTGLASLIGKNYIGLPLPSVPSISIYPFKSSIDIITIFSLLIVPIVSFIIFKTRWGLTLRAIGDNHNSAHALGIRVNFVRTQAILISGALCGLSGSIFTLVANQSWSDGNVTGGRGWIAIALVIFAAWMPYRVLFGAILYGTLSIWELYFQSLGVKLPKFVPLILTSLPYLATIIILVIISAEFRRKFFPNKRFKNVASPGSLGKNFHNIS